MNDLLARNIRRFREELQISMGELARRSGLSKQTLSKIEQGIGNPTIDSISSIADAMHIPVRRLVTEWGNPLFVQRGAAAAWDEDGAAWALRRMDEVYGSGYVRTLIVRLRRAGQQRQSFTGGTPGTLHHVYVIMGQVRVGPVKDLVTLGEGDFARFPGDAEHRIVCLSTEATLHVVTTVPQVPQFATGN
ncbi:helix-turn-helix domain-containing protein [Dactylosporangium sp. NPDC048998]|uniref:helix-turn-helix domain-containing protein n=1 Tax=Dactylosporangium sp. NPDC048998 TaxID=3363976 RepID=UPI0037132888